MGWSAWFSGLPLTAVPTGTCSRSSQAWDFLTREERLQGTRKRRRFGEDSEDSNETVTCRVRRVVSSRALLQNEALPLDDLQGAEPRRISVLGTCSYTRTGRESSTEPSQRPLFEAGSRWTGDRYEQVGHPITLIDTPEPSARSVQLGILSRKQVSSITDRRFNLCNSRYNERHTRQDKLQGDRRWPRLSKPPSTILRMPMTS